MKNILSPDDFKRLQELIEAVIAAHAQARETQENKKCVSGFDREAFLGEKELYSDHIIGCAVSATHYQDCRITAATTAKIADCINQQYDIEKYPHLKRFIEDENLQKSYPNAQKELQTLAEIKNIFLKISASLEEKSTTERKTAMIWNIIYIIFLLCSVLLLLWNCFESLLFLPLMILLWLAGMIWAIILPVKAIREKERRWYWTFLPLFCIIATAVLHFLPLPWHIWNAQITYFSKRNEWQEMIKNPAKENVISRTEQRTVIGFLHGESVLTRYEDMIVHISDDALPQKEMFPMAEKVTVYRKLAPNWYYLQVKY